jgi:hypothetical protein
LGEKGRSKYQRDHDHLLPAVNGDTACCEIPTNTRTIDIFSAHGWPYELLLVAQASDDRTFEKFALAVSMAGNAEGTAMRAFDEIEYRAIIKDLP